MGKHPQSRFRRLVLVGPSEQPRHHFLHSSHWGDAQTPAVQSTRAEFKALRMAVMPTFSRGIWLEALSATISTLIEIYYASMNARSDNQRAKSEVSIASALTKVFWNVIEPSKQLNLRA